MSSAYASSARGGKGAPTCLYPVTATTLPSGCQFMEQVFGTVTASAGLLAARVSYSLSAWARQVWAGAELVTPVRKYKYQRSMLSTQPRSMPIRAPRPPELLVGQHA